MAHKRSKHIFMMEYSSLEGNVTICAVLSLLTIALAFLLTIMTIRVRIINEQAIQIEDGMAASSMAGMTVDFDRYAHTYMTGKTDVVISDYNKSYHNFCYSMQTCLNDAVLRQNGISQVRVNQYIIYNVIWNRDSLVQGERRIEAIFFDQNGTVSFSKIIYGNAYAPNGIQIKETSVYADVTFRVEIKKGLALNAHKQLLSEVKKI